VLLVKGAAECVLERCDRVMLPDGKVVKLTPTLRSSVLSCVGEMADSALRILALARRCVWWWWGGVKGCTGQLWPGTHAMFYFLDR
jgi:magnesium-transporting ATPase (P-type)